MYHSLFSSHLSYGLVVWGNASRWNLERIRSLQKRVLRLIAPGYNGDFNHILSDLKILDLDHQLQVQLSLLMWDYDRDTLPTSLKPHIKGNLDYSKVYTSKYGIKYFKYQGVKILNYLKSMNIYQNAISKSFFLKQLKAELLSTYLTK